MTSIIVIGTSHIAQQSVKEIKNAIIIHKPTIIAVELDAKRLHALLSKQKSRIHLNDITRIGVKGFLFALIGSYVQKKLGKMVGTAPGSDMLQAAKLAHSNGILLALIDQDIEITLKRFSKYLSWKERGRFLIDIFRGIFFKKSEMKRYGLDKLDLTRVPEEELIRKLIAPIKKRYPNVYKVIIDERNQYMTTQLRKLAQEHPEAVILAVVGAGHKEAIEKATK